MKRIPLTQEKYALVDDSDFELVSRFKWYARKIHNIWYAQTSVSLGALAGKPQSLCDRLRMVGKEMTGTLTVHDKVKIEKILQKSYSECRPVTITVTA